MDNFVGTPVELQFHNWVKNTPSETAIEMGSKKISYSDLNRQVNIVANYFVLYELKTTEPVFVFISDPLRVIAVLLACFRVGVIFVPIDTTVSSSQFKSMLRSIKPKYILVDTPSSSLLLLLCNKLDIELRVFNIDKGNNDKELPSNYFSNVDMDIPCCIYFSSGSTGIPKAITNTRNGISHFVKWEIEEFFPNTSLRVTQLTQPFYDAFLRDIFVALCSGGTICVPDSQKTIYDMKSLSTWINSVKPHVMHTIPTIFRKLMNDESNEFAADSLRCVFLAGERLLPNDITNWFERYAGSSKLVNLYGPTETTMTKLFHVIEESDQYKKVVPIGKPITDVDVFLLDEDGGHVDTGRIGEIIISPPFKVNGYYNNKELTESVISKSTQCNGRQLYRTGDFGRVISVNNEYEFLGRKDQQVKIHGIRVELSEVESYINQFPGIKQSVVTNVGIGSKICIAAYLLANIKDETQFRKKLSRFLSSHFPPRMQPLHFKFVAEIPTLPNGKVNYSALPGIELKRQKPADNNFIARLCHESCSISEFRLMQIWKKHLKLNVIEIEDNYFYLGGDSLTVFSIINSIQEEFGVELTLECFLRAPCILSLAKEIDSKSTVTPSPVVLLNSPDSKKLPIWLIHPPGGDVLIYAKLASFLDSKITVYGLQYPTLHGGGHISDLKELASYYLKHILKTNIPGPYYVGGWSMGGVIAIELAKQLSARGSEVGQIILFDTDFPFLQNGFDVRTTQHKTLTSLINYMRIGFGVQKCNEKKYRKLVLDILRLISVQFIGVKLTRQDIINHHLDSCKILNGILSLHAGAYIRLMSILPLNLLLRLNQDDQLSIMIFLARISRLLPSDFSRYNYSEFMNIFRENVSAVCRYSMDRIDSNIIFFAAVKSNENNLASQYWGEISSGNTQKIEIDADHFSMFREPNVRELADHLNRLC